MADESSTTLALVPPVGPNAYSPTAGEDFPPGTPLVQSNDTNNTVFKGDADAAASSQVVGLARGVGNTGRNCHTQFAGPLSLTTAQWDAVTGGSGGLTRGATYYLSSATAGRITATRPTSPNYACKVGVALSSKTLLIGIDEAVVGESP